MCFDLTKRLKIFTAIKWIPSLNIYCWLCSYPMEGCEAAQSGHLALLNGDEGYIGCLSNNAVHKANPLISRRQRKMHSIWHRHCPESYCDVRVFVFCSHLLSSDCQHILYRFYQVCCNKSAITALMDT